MRDIRKKHHIPENKTNFFIDPSLYNPMSNLEKQAVNCLRGGKGEKKSTADSVTTQTSDLPSLTAKVDKLAGCVAKISQIVGKRHACETNPDYNSDEETLFPDNSGSLHPPPSLRRGGSL